MSDTPDFSFLVDVSGLPSVGREYAIEADAAARERVAPRLGVQAVSELKARFTLMPRAGGLVRITGPVQANVVQTCVVTLVALPAKVSEDVDVTFATKAPKTPDPAEAEELVVLSDEEPPEEAFEGIVDLGELAVAQIALGLDPYPRAPGAAFDPAAWTPPVEKEAQESPFAVLAELKKKKDS